MAAEERLDSSALLDCEVTVPRHIVYRAFALETVVVNLDQGLYHGINATGGRMLEVLERSATARDAAAQLAAEYALPTERVEADLCAFCSDLLARGLVEVRS